MTDTCHLSKMQKNKEFTVVSIFINPKQFGPREDLDNYPTNIQRDIKKLNKLKVNLLFIPQKKEIFNYDISSYNYTPLKIANILCGKHRPNYFPGVADIIIRLFSIIDPDKSYFGKKISNSIFLLNHSLKN